jgi:hypothetical protein
VTLEMHVSMQERHLSLYLQLLPLASFGGDKGCNAIAVNDLYGLKMSWAAWHDAFLVENTLVSMWQVLRILTCS